MLRSIAASLLLAGIACSTGQISEAESGNASPKDLVTSPGPATTPAIDAGAPVPTFAVDVEPIIQAKCQNCHHDGGIAPFPLVSYEDVTSHGYNAQRRVTAREMPPWGAFDTDDCKLQHKLKDDLRLGDDQISTISRWVDAGMPMGDATKRPPPRTTFPALSMEGATSFAMPKPYKVEPGVDDIRCFPIDPNITEDTWITATNVRPGDPRVVHHVIVYLDKSKKGPSKVTDDTGSYKCFGGPGLGDNLAGTGLLLAWAPGVPPTGLGQTDAGIKIPKDAGLVMQVHYHPTNVPVMDQSSFEILKKPAGERPSHVALVQLAGNAKTAAGTESGGLVKLLPGPDDPGDVPTFLIPANATAHTESMEITPPASLASLSTLGIKAHFALAGAHMHWAGTNLTMKIERGAPVDEPKNECLIATPKYDFNWQRGYTYDEEYDKLPTIAAGDKIHLECTYNNSTTNKNVAKAIFENQQPISDLHLGETTRDEMCLGAFVIVRDFIPGFD